MAENFPNLGKETDIQVQEANRLSRKRNPKRFTLRHLIIKVAKVKENLKGNKKKTTDHIQGKPHKAIS